MKLYIKYMVSSRCIMVVKELFQKHRLNCIEVELGEVEIVEMISEDVRSQLKDSLHDLGFELMEDKRSVLIEKIKTVVYDMIDHSDDLYKENFSDYLSKKLNYDYNYLANLFSEVQGITIEHFMISLRIERIKELITNGELNISEIAWMMNYSSVAHLSSQFKKVTGLTPLNFKNMKDTSRNPIERTGTQL